MNVCHRFFSLAALLACSASLSAAESRAAAWASLPRSAQAVAEAGGLGVLANGLPSLGLNPAGLATDQGAGSVRLDHSSWPGAIQSQNLSFGLGFSNGIRAALDGQWVDYGAIQATTYVAGQGVSVQGSLRPNAGSVGLSLAGALKAGIEAGASVKYLTESLTGDSRSNAVALDAGIRGGLGSGLSLALSVANLGSALNGSNLPGVLRLGGAWKAAEGVFELGVEANSAADALSAADVAAALRLRFSEYFTARTGWLQTNAGEGQPSVGATFSVGAWSLDYAFRQSGALGASHHVGLEYRW